MGTLQGFKASGPVVATSLLVDQPITVGQRIQFSQVNANVPGWYVVDPAGYVQILFGGIYRIRFTAGLNLAAAGATPTSAVFSLRYSQSPTSGWVVFEQFETYVPNVNNRFAESLVGEAFLTFNQLQPPAPYRVRYVDVIATTLVGGAATVLGSPNAYTGLFIDRVG